MYYNNIYFHNVNLMKKDENGNFLLSRFEEDFLLDIVSKNPQFVPKTNLSPTSFFDNITDINALPYNFTQPINPSKELKPFTAFNDLSLGVELRFKIVSDTVKIKLKLMQGQSPAVCEVFFGNFFAGKEYCLNITDYNVLEYTFNKCSIPTAQKKSIKKNETTFANDVIRILLPARNVLFVAVEGQTEIPQVYEMPNKNVVFLGSNNLGTSNAENPSNSIAFETASKLNANCYNLSANFITNVSKKISSFISSLGIQTIIISELIFEEIDDSTYELKLRNIKQNIKSLAKFKKKVFYIDYLFNYFNFANPKRAIKAKAFIEKLLKKEHRISPYESYANCITFGLNELPAFAIGKITFDIVECVTENYGKLKIKQKVTDEYIYYSIKTAEDEPTLKPAVMKSKEKRKYLKELKINKRKNK